MISLNSSRQDVAFAYVEFTFADVANTSGLIQQAVKIPTNGVVVGGALVVDTAFNSGVDTLSVGDLTVANRYGNAISMETAGRTALTLTGHTVQQGEFGVTVTYTAGSSNPTAGSARLEVAYIIKGVAEYTQD